jgi:hypothetical protein
MLNWQQSSGVTAALAVAAAGLRFASALRPSGLRPAVAAEAGADRAEPDQGDDSAGNVQPRVMTPAASTVVSAPPGGRLRWLAAFMTEACIVAALYTIWQLGGQLSLMGAGNALRRGRWIAGFERSLHLPSERSVQDLILGHSWLVQLANLYYDVMHFGVIFVFLLWLFIWHRDRYRAIRTTLAITTLACLAIQLVPVAPPRLIGGYVDTAAAYGESVYAGDMAGQLFAMPSVHVTWAVLVGWYVWRVGRGPWRALGPLHSAVTVFVVVATGNHWWLDGIVGVSVLIVCAWARYGIARAWATARAKPATEAVTQVFEPA